jgi:hypothetical protein
VVLWPCSSPIMQHFSHMYPFLALFDDMI